MKRAGTSDSSEIKKNKLDDQSGNSMLEKWEKSKPYNLFFTKIPNLPNNNNWISFGDLLCSSLGNLKSCLLINYLVDPQWLLEQFKEKNLQDKSITVLYGKLINSIQLPQNVILKDVTPHDVNYGLHHSKIGILVYDDDSVRIIVSTANLMFEDWNNYNQGLWISPRCQALSKPSANKGESPTGFKNSLLTYLESYKIIKDWIEIIKTIDFTNIQVFFINSVTKSDCHWQQMKRILSQHCDLTNEESKSWDVIAQASSLGSFENSPDWLETTFLTSLASQIGNSEKPQLKIIFPSRNNTNNCLFGEKGSHCLSNLSLVYNKQKWLKKYLHHWKAEKSSRTQVMPHIKTYCRVSPCLSRLAWFLLSSANISKGAWGFALKRYDRKPYVLSYEAGVLFLPKFFGQDFFHISGTDNLVFPFMYDLPLTKYEETDEPFCHEPDRKFD